ncbi:MAG: hypothetical protein A3K04_02965 [Gallionellales bacterium RBG_16_56_9]|nr:MAG: hypothetical protein A3K04_02965 [Gallionellales bacterium RBG_16_56_9]
MARPGILYSQVAATAAKLAAVGTNPTVDNVREAMGNTGSKSTIGPMLKRWKSEQQEAVSGAQTGLPAELVNAVKHLYQQAQRDAQQQTQVAHDELAVVKADFTVRLQAALDATTALSVERDGLAAALDRERDAHARLAADHQVLQVTEAGMRAEVTGLNERLQDRRTELENAQQQLGLARTQFEHYQDATAQQRAEERRQYEQARNLADAELAETRRQLSARDLALSGQAHQLTDCQQAARRTAAELAAGVENQAKLERECQEHKQQLGTQLAFVAQLDGRLQAAAAGLSEAHSKLAVLRNERRQLLEGNGVLDAKVNTLEAAVQTLQIEKALLASQLPAAPSQS